MSSTMAVLCVPAALLLVGAGAAKFLRPHNTARAAAAIWPPLSRLVRPLAALEVVVGVAVLVVGGRGAMGAMAASYAGFAGFVIWALVGRRPLATCGCFGEPDTPPTIGHAIVCAVMAGLAGAAVGGRPGASVLVLADSLARSPATSIALGTLLIAATLALYAALAVAPKTVAAIRQRPVRP